MRLFDRIFRTSPGELLLRDGQRWTYLAEKEALQREMDHVAAQGTGYVVRYTGRPNVPKDDWLADAAIRMGEIDAHIGELESIA